MRCAAGLAPRTGGTFLRIGATWIVNTSEYSSEYDVLLSEIVDRFLYMLILAVDANVRLKNRMRANEIDDPSLGPGWGYFVEPRKYEEHIKKYVAEKDVCMFVCLCVSGPDE